MPEPSTFTTLAYYLKTNSRQKAMHCVITLLFSLETKHLFLSQLRVQRIKVSFLYELSPFPTLGIGHFLPSSYLLGHLSPSLSVLLPLDSLGETWIPPSIADVYITQAVGRMTPGRKSKKIRLSPDSGIR